MTPAAPNRRLLDRPVIQQLTTQLVHYTIEINIDCEQFVHNWQFTVKERNVNKKKRHTCATQYLLSKTSSYLTVLENRIRSLFVFKSRKCLYRFLSRYNLLTEMSKNSFHSSNANIFKTKGEWHFAANI